MLYYFAYGSNLHPIRLMERTPSARLIGVAQYTHYRLAFHKKSHDGSGKCHLLNTHSESDLVYGAIYKLDSSHKKDLDVFEGKGNGYVDAQISLEYQSRKYTCFTYFAQQSYIMNNLRPYHWYKQLVVLGARYLQFPDSYIESIECVESIDDPDEQRKHENAALIERIVQCR